MSIYLPEPDRLALIDLCRPLVDQVVDDGAFRRTVTVFPEYDCNRFPCIHGSDDCTNGDPGKNHGQCGRRIVFGVAAVGLGAVAFELLSPVYPDGSSGADRPYAPLGPLSLHHQHQPGYLLNDEPATDCGLVDEGAPCYPDVTYLQAETAVATLLAGGVTGVWAWLAEQWLPSLTPRPVPEG